MKHIKAIITDCDGVMTDGKVWLANDGSWQRAFNILDGLGIVELLKTDIYFAIITGSTDPDIQARCEQLGIENLIQTKGRKLDYFNKILADNGFSADEVIYIGDDISDIEILEEVGHPFTVPNAAAALFDKGYQITERKGGDGALREVIDLVLAANNYT